MKAKKSLGQHFLKSERALSTMAETGDLSRDDTVIEIGPGTGNLTTKLLATGARVIAVEKDDRLFVLLEDQFKKEISLKQLTLIHDDILDCDLSRLTTSSYKLVANIPYNITGAILKKFLTDNHQPKKIVLLMQKEVVQRIIAKDSKQSILSLSVKAYGTPKYIETVKAGSFVPAPKVDSAIMSIENISKTFFTDFTEDNFFKIVKTGFKSKRKKLSSNLSTLCAKEKIHEIFLKLNLNENLRAEDAGIEIWKKLAKLI